MLRTEQPNAKMASALFDAILLVNLSPSNAQVEAQV
jgi:hypothetical protein